MGVAYYSMFVQTTKNGAPNSMWAKGAAHMLAKCAEALAIRKAFPNETSGLYTELELGVNTPQDVEPQDSSPQPSEATEDRTKLLNPSRRVVPYGNAKGKLPAELAAEDLEYHISAAERAVNDPKKARYLESNTEWYHVLLAEREERKKEDQEAEPELPQD